VAGEAVLINAVKWSFIWKLNSPQSIAWCYDGFPGMGGRVQYVITRTLISKSLYQWMEWRHCKN